MLSPGVVLQQRYRIRRLLARGGMGAVYEAEAVHLRNVIVAVKETFFNEDRKGLREQFEREAATLARLRHPALPQVMDHFIEGAGQFLVMDYIEGEDLGALLERRLNRRREPFGFWQVMEWAERLLDTLVYIHGQYPPVIHRDIKPQNLKLTPRGELFLIDFGLAKDATTPTRPGHSLHAYTLEFAPPEQIKGEGTDARIDIYSLGATLYQLATGKLPPDARLREEAVVKHLMPDLLVPTHQVNPQMPIAFAAALAKAMALYPDLRFQSAQEMRQELSRIKQNAEAEFADIERQAEERRRSEEEALHREVEQRGRREEAGRPYAARAEAVGEEEDPGRLKQAPQQEAVTEPAVSQTAADEKPVDQGKAAQAAPAVRRKAPRLALIAIAAGLLIALFVYPWLNPATPTPDMASGAAPQISATPTPDKAPSPDPTIVAGAENGPPPPPPGSSYEVLPARIVMVYVPEGSFLMGSPPGEPDIESNEVPQHQVTVPGFYLGKYEVTRAQWRAVMGISSPNLKDGDLPVTNVDWNEVKDFCNRLSQKTDARYRLPTEAEWEYACSGGTTGAYGRNNINAMAWHMDNSNFKPHPVGRKRPNAFGIYDMLGNAQEWCEDSWHDSYAGAPTDGSAWGNKSGYDSSRVIRGCYFFSDITDCRPANRDDTSAGIRSDWRGFRIARSYP
ncbi:MAG TPA: bifunctional serine/threonine-protein kinase/formylglycine-generating enzyme family protein [Blastocatellia bacterium]